MNENSVLSWAALIGGGFLIGGIMFSQIFPKIILGKDIYGVSADHNPGSANVFISCGVPLGFLCLFFDMLKGFLPVFLAVRLLDVQQIYFAAVLTAPVLGHALAPFNHFHGGKCIATTFGEMLALLPETRVGLILAGLYILFSVIVKVNPIHRRSILTFSLFGILSAAVLIAEKRYSFAVGCVLISVIAIVRHMRRFCVPSESIGIEETAGSDE